MDEKLRFVSRHLEGESISQLCREFGISRVTGHKLVERYRQNGLEAFSDRSRRPYRMANQLPFQVEALIVQIKNEFPTWGAPKIRERLLARYPEIKTPAKSTVHAVLERNSLVKHKSVEWHPKLSHFEENLHPNLSHPNRLSCLIFEQGWARSDQRGNFEQIT
jgi:putative transposase